MARQLMDSAPSLAKEVETNVPLHTRQDVFDGKPGPKPLQQCLGRFWHPLTLQFSDRHAERQYEHPIHQEWLKLDNAMHLVGLIPSLAMLSASDQFYHRAAWGSACAIAVIAWFLSSYCCKLYAKVRTLLVCWIRITIPLFLSVFGPGAAVESGGVVGILSMVLKNSPVTALMLLPVKFRIPFRQHLVVHSIAAIFALVWVPGFCELIKGVSDSQTSLMQIGDGIDAAFHLLFLNILKSDKQQNWPDCWAVSTTAYIVLGVLLPTFFLFLLETFSRADFLKRHYAMSGDDSKELGIYKWDAVACSFWALCFGSTFAWFTFSSVW